MPRKKQNVEAYGKSWSPIDLPNLEKAIKLYERLNYLQDHFANSLSGSQAIMQQINEKTDIQNELQRLGIKLTEDQAKEVAGLIKKRQEENQELDKSNNLKKSTYGALTGDTIKNQYNRQQGYTRPDTSVYQQRSLQGFLNNASSIYTTGRQNKVYNQAVQSEINRIKATGSIMSDAGIQKAAELNIKNGKMGNEASQLLNKSAQGFSKGASVIQVAADTLLAGINKLTTLFFAGVNKQSQVYEDTFTNISVRNRTTRSQYYDAQRGINDELQEQGLFNNVASSDVMQMWNTLASQGIKIDMNSEEDRAQATAKAIETVVTNTIVPYLNTSSASFQQFADQQPNLIKQVRGIGLTTQDISGSSIVANKYLQDMIDSLSPMGALAEQELGLQFAQMTGEYENLRAQGYSDALIGKLYSGAATMYNDPMAALNSGNLDLVMATANMIESGGDFRNAADVASAYNKSANFVSNLTPEGRLSSLYAGVTNTYLDVQGKTEMNERNADLNAAEEAGRQTAAQTEAIGNKAAEDLANDMNQTNQKLQELTMENISNEFATLKEFMGHWYDVIVTAIKGIAGTLAAGVIGKGIGALAGSAAGGTGSGILASSGGIALGTVGTVAASAALVAAIGAGIYQADQKNKEESAKTAEENFKNSDSSFASSDTAGKFVSGAGAELNTDDLTGWGKFMRSAGDAIDTWGLGIRKGWTGITNFFDGKKGWTDTDYVGKNAQYWNSIVANGLRDFNSDEDRGGYYAAYAFLLDQVNSLESTNKMGEPITKDDLKALFTTVNPDTGESLFKYWSIGSKMSYFVNNNLVPTGEDGTKANGDIDYASVYEAPKGSYRIGLNRVPYDNYPALLHEDETVLTASTANELRNLTDTYRETSQQSISFDTIIQSQTDTLCAKLDQVITAISNISTGALKPSWDENSVLNNMKNLKNLNTFNN